MHNIIIDTDPGVDDAQAIAFAVAHPDINLLGLTTVFGNASIEITSRNALKVLEIFGRPDLPVAKGASRPLVQERMPSPDFVHGVDGMGNLHLAEPVGQISDETAGEFIVRSVNAQPGEITLVAIGPLTNIAEALKLDPDLPKNTKELVIMGGTVDEPGNVSPVAEANFLGDPHAADIVFAVDWSTTIIGLDVTHKTLLRDRDFAELRDGAKNTGQLLWDSSRFYIDFYSTERELSENDERSCAMHDASTVVYLLERDAFECVSGPARVVTQGVAKGQLIVDRAGHDYPLPHWQNRPSVRAAMQVDSERIRKTFVDTIVNNALI